MVGHPVHGIDNGLGRLKVHVSHHQRNGFGVCLHPFDGISSVAVNDFVEIVSHLGKSFLSVIFCFQYSIKPPLCNEKIHKKPTETAGFSLFLPKKIPCLDLFSGL